MTLQKNLINKTFKFILKNKSFKTSKKLGLHLALYIDTHIILYIHNCKVSHRTRSSIDSMIKYKKHKEGAIGFSPHASRTVDS
jgi:hypothetical protein